MKKKNFFFQQKEMRKQVLSSLLNFSARSPRKRGVSVKKTSCPCFYFYTIWVFFSLPDGEEPNSD